MLSAFLKAFPVGRRDACAGMFPPVCVHMAITSLFATA